jgi:hypothetical protein
MSPRARMNEPVTVEELERVLWLIYITTGADADGVDPPRGNSTPVEQFALKAVEELRRDYDEALEELWP